MPQIRGCLQNLQPTFFSEFAAAIKHDDRQYRHHLSTQRVSVCVNAQPVELEERNRPRTENTGFLQRFHAVTCEYH